jgi:hypothetical protein
VIGCSGWDRVSEREGELVKELRVRCGEVEGDRVRLVVDDDPAYQMTVPWRPLTLDGADDAGVVRGRADVDGETAFDRAAEIFWSDRRPVGVPDARAEVEGVGRAAVDRRR